AQGHQTGWRRSSSDRSTCLRARLRLRVRPARDAATSYDPRVRTVVLVLTVGAFASLAATGGASTAKATPGCKAPAKWRGDNRSNYEADCADCKLFGPRAYAREYHISSSNPVTVALRYARFAYRPAYRQAGFEGCLRGFVLRRRP